MPSILTPGPQRLNLDTRWAACLSLLEGLHSRLLYLSHHPILDTFRYETLNPEP